MARTEGQGLAWKLYALRASQVFFKQLGPLGLGADVTH